MDIKNGIKTTEFWVTIVGLICATVLFAIGKTESGTIVLSIVTGGYAISRGMAKLGTKSSTVAKLITVGFALVMVSGCCSADHVSVDAIEGTVIDVCDVHDQLLEGKMDPKDLSGEKKVEVHDLRKRTFLRNSEELRAVIKEAKAKK